MNPDHALLIAAAEGRCVLPRTIDSSPLAALLGTQLVAVDAAAGALVLGFDPDASLRQGRGVVQGGIVAAMLDFACAFAVLLQLGPARSTATASLNLGFMRATRIGPLQARARVQRLGASLAFASAELHQDEQLVAAASATLPIFNLRPDEGSRP